MSVYVTYSLSKVYIIFSLSPSHSSYLDLRSFQIFETGDDVQKLNKKFKEGGLARVRIIGIKNVEGLAVGTMKVVSEHGLFFFF